MTDADDAPDLAQLQHDLRTPLVIVSGFAQLLAADGDIDPATRQDYARRITKASTELQRLIAERLSP